MSDDGYINIALASDNNYAQHVAVVMASIRVNTLDDVKLRIFLLADSIDEENINKLNITASKLNVVLEIVDISSMEFFSNLFISGHLSKATYFRLALSDILPTYVHRIIYMDVDIVVMGDIQELWNMDLHDKPLGATCDFGIMGSSRLMKQKRDVIGLEYNEMYFNAGVLIMDIDQWRLEKYGNMVIELVANNRFPHHDQDALNKVFKNNWHKIPLKWDVIPPVYNLFMKILLNSNLRKEAIEAKLSMGIMHYAGRYKPWEFARFDSFNDKYYDYLAITDYAGVSMPQPSKNMQGKSITRQLYRLKLADFWCKIFG